MKKIYTDELKQIQLDIMDDVHSFCEEKGISYFLAYGSLIGAVRHNGYIPWDDDVDIWMPRPDYDRFVELYNQKDSHYRMVCFEINKDFFLPFGKVYDTRTVMNEMLYKRQNHYGVYVDVFPIDGFKNENQIKQAQRLRRYLNVKNAILGVGRSCVKDFLILMAKIWLMFKSAQDIMEEINIIVKENNFAASEEVGYLPTLYRGKRGIFPRVFFEHSRLADFSGRKYRIPLEFDRILTAEYGDYMQVPSEDKRVSTHVFEAWWKD